MSATITYLCWMAFLGLIAKCAMKRDPHELEELYALAAYTKASD